ncbi:MAG TPA: glycerophosphodiester phosphodiesterase [Pseudonocardia sp.]|nr:glycerophosphodiester phosphodiesterase [Pseudonocardia sp.]
MPHESVFASPPAVLGHRGCGRGSVGGHPENTLGSFLAAVELGVDWVEVDVRRTRDDQLIVVHDPAGTDGVFYTDVTGDEAAARGALRVEELLEALPAHVGVDFDLKTSLEDATVTRAATTAATLAAVTARESRRRPVLVTTFDPGGLAIVGELAPGVPRGLLTWTHFPIAHAVAAAGHLDVQVLAAHWGSLLPGDLAPQVVRRPLEYVVDVVHRSGREVLVWCPPPESVPQLLAAGVDAVCVDDVPDFLAAAVHARTSGTPRS